MRTPSIYSQDDPISAALQPASDETETERKARLEQEAEAKRISEEIDEELRLERERIKRSKGDVKVTYKAWQLLFAGYMRIYSWIWLATLASASGTRYAL